MRGVPQRKKVTVWISVAAGLVFIYSALVVYFLNSPPPEGTILYRITAGFVGNITGGILVSVLFLLIALHTDAQTESKIDRIRSVVENHDYRREIEQKIKEFERLLREESYYDVRFPDLVIGNQTLGLSYTIEPVRDQRGNPLEKVIPFSSYYVVRVIGPAHEEVMDEDDLLDYEMSPICEDEFYYCRFYNGDWHMGKIDGGASMHRFYTSSSVSPAYYAESANRFVGASDLPPGFEVVLVFFTLPSGEEMTGTGMCNRWELLKGPNDAVYVRTEDSRPKRVYQKTEENTFNSNKYYTVVENIRGHFGGESLCNFTAIIERKCLQAGLTIPKYEWHEVASN